MPLYSELSFSTMTSVTPLSIVLNCRRSQLFGNFGALRIKKSPTVRTINAKAETITRSA